MSAPAITLRADTSSTPFGGTPVWTDLTAYLLTAGDGQPITVTWGRQDEKADPSPATCTFVLDNTDGRFTPGNAAAAAGWDVDARVNVRVTVSATTYDRFDGYIDSIEPAFGGSSWSKVAVSCTDVTARLGLSQPLRSLVEQEMLADNPTYLYPLSEAESSVSAGNVSGALQPSAVPRNGKYGAGSVQFGAALAGFAESSQTGVAFGPTNTSTPGAVSVLSITYYGENGPKLPVSGAHSQECWIVPPATAPADFADILYQSIGPNSSNCYAILYVAGGSGVLAYRLTDATGTTVVPATATSICDGKLHHVVATLAADGKTAKLYFDGVLVDTKVAASVLNFTGIAANLIGGLLGLGNNQSGYQFPGTVAEVALYPTELSAARVLAHYQAGRGLLTERTDQRYARLANYSGLTANGLPTGVGAVRHQSIAGRSITDALQQVARTEGTVSYATAAGALTFQARTARYNAASGLSVTSADVNPDLTIRRDRQGKLNEITVNRDGGASQRVVDTANQTAVGRFDGGSFDVCASTDDDALQNANWRVQTGKRPKTRLPSLTLDLLTQPTAATVQAALSASISTLVNVSGLQSQAPSSSLSVFVEGGTEQIGVTAWSITYYTSPNLPQVWKVTAGPDPASLLDGSNLVGF